jgi:hypothetical protein
LSACYDALAVFDYFSIPVTTIGCAVIVVRLPTRLMVAAAILRADYEPLTLGKFFFA